MTKSLSFRTDVQGLRGVAIILVLLFHFETPLRGGYLGVDMFFVISGLVDPPPRFSVDLRYDLSLIQPNNMAEPRFGVSVSEPDLSKIEEASLDGIPYVQPILKFADLFCNAKTCSPKVNGLYMYEDDNHLSVDGSMYVAPMLQDAISSALRNS